MINPYLIPGGSFPNRQLRPFPGVDEPLPPQNTVAPAITGVPTVGNNLSVSNGAWVGASSFAYQWFRNGLPIASATSNTYLLVAADQGKLITAAVTATGATGSVSALSNQVGPIA